MHALTIEPQVIARMMLEEELRNLGFTSCDAAITQQEAIAAARRRRPDLITTGIRLSEGNGIEAVRIICEQQPIPTIYIVSNREEVQQAIKGSRIIVKPILPEELERAVQQVTQGVGGSRNAEHL
jgi:CheY-like chemotaxis protein